MIDVAIGGGIAYATVCLVGFVFAFFKDLEKRFASGGQDEN